MSIYSTWLSIDDESHEVDCDTWQEVTKEVARNSGSYMSTYNNKYFVRVDRPCTCQSNGPIIYQGSHVNPSEDDPRGGVVHVSAIPNHCHPDARGTDDPGKPVEFLRVGVEPGDPDQGNMVVLTRGQVKKLRNILDQWLTEKERY